MKSKIGISNSKNVSSAVQEATASFQNPQAIIFMTSYNLLEATAKEIKEKFPNAQSIGSSGTMFAQGKLYETGLVIMALEEIVSAVAGIVPHLSTCPIADVMKIEQNIAKVAPGREDTVCIEFCTNDEEKYVTTMNAGLRKHKIALIGGTVFGYPSDVAGQVACNGQVTSDAACYLFVKNKGKAKVYKQNIYGKMNVTPHIATKVDIKTKELIELDHRPAAEVYGQELGISKDKIVDNVLQNPMGRILGEDVYISSMHTMKPNGALLNYKRINRNDTIYFLDLLEYTEIMADTVREIQNDFHKISAVVSVDCIYRYLLMQRDHSLQQYLDKMSKLGPHIGIVGGGEQYNEQHVNQTMVCAVFE